MGRPEWDPAPAVEKGMLRMSAVWIVYTGPA
jgi:hypothetical protein